MKKYLCLVLALSLLLAFAVPTSAADSDEYNLLNMFYDKNISPVLYSGAFSSFISFDTLSKGTGYKLRDASDKDNILDEISVCTDRELVTTDELSEYFDAFYDFFDGNDDDFELFESFVIKSENVILPFPNQSRALGEFPMIAEYIAENFYGATYFFNLLAALTDSYYSGKGKDPIFMLDDGLALETDAYYYADFFENSNKSIGLSLIDKLNDAFTFINSADELEKNEFISYLTVNAVVSEDVAKQTAERDTAVDSIYNSYQNLYANFNDSVAAFESPLDIAKEYIPKINSSTGLNKSAYISEAMTKAATFTLKNSTATLPQELLTFAIASAAMVRNELIDAGISVPQSQSFNIIINTNADGFNIVFPSASFGGALGYKPRNLFITSKSGDLVTSCTAIQKYDISNTVTFSLKYGAAEDINASLADYTSGRNLMEIKIYSADVFDGYIQKDDIYFRKDVSRIAGDYEDNIYSALNDSGYLNSVNMYEYENGYISFEIGADRYFVNMLEEEKKPADSDNNTENDGKTDNTNGNGTNNTQINNNPSVSDNDNTNTGNPTDIDNTDTNNNTPDKKVEFKDVPDTHWANRYVILLAEKGIVSGIGDSMFAPDNNIKREEFAKIIVEAFNLNLVDSESIFDDVADDAWYAPYVMTAFENGIVKGVSDSEFGSGNNITRQDMCVMITRAAEANGLSLAEPSESNFNDAKLIADYAQKAVFTLTNMKIITGFEDNTVRPNANATRAQASKIIASLIYGEI